MLMLVLEPSYCICQEMINIKLKSTHTVNRFDHTCIQMSVWSTRVNDNSCLKILCVCGGGGGGGGGGGLNHMFIH